VINQSKHVNAFIVFKVGRDDPNNKNSNI